MSDILKFFIIAGLGAVALITFGLAITYSTKKNRIDKPIILPIINYIAAAMAVASAILIGIG